MPLNPSQTYVYVDPALTNFTVFGGDLTDTGPWRAATFYAVGNVVEVGKDLYLARTPSHGQAPTSIVDAHWSCLIAVSITNGTDLYARQTATEAYSTGTYALTEALLGLDAAATAQNTANEVSVIAYGAENTAYTAWVLAQIGTNTGSYAISLAGSTSGDGPLAGQAWTLAQFGTNTGTYALAVANEALSIAIIGTNAAASAQDAANGAWVLAQYGTNTGTYALQVGQEALSIAVLGTNAAASALASANEGVSIAIIGTNAAATAQNRADAAFSIAVIGTNTGSAAYSYAAAGTFLPAVYTGTLALLDSVSGSWAFLTIANGQLTVTIVQ